MKVHIMTLAKQIRQVIKRQSLVPLLSCESWIFMKENPDRKKVNSTLQHLGSNFWSMMGKDHLNALSLVYIHQDIFLDYNKIIDIYPSKYPRRMLLINPRSENYTVETFNTRKTYKVYINFHIFSLYFIVVIFLFCFN